MEDRYLPCSICLERIPEERDDTIIWQDVRFAIDQKEVATGQGEYGPFLAAHPDCFKLVEGRMNEPCLACGEPMAPVSSEVPKRGRWACGTCHREFEERFLGRLKEVAPPTPLRHRPGMKYVTDRIENLGRGSEGDGGESAQGRI